MTKIVPLALLWLLASCRLSPTAALAAAWEHGLPGSHLTTQDSTSLLQFQFEFQVDHGSRNSENLAGRAGFDATGSWPKGPSADAKLEHSLEHMLGLVRGGFWSQKQLAWEGCGKSNLRELSTNLGSWRKEHPNEDGFCYFQNLAFWFTGAGSVTYYPFIESMRRGWSFSSQMCHYLGQSKGPERNITFENGVMTFKHLDHCIDAVDDPYCYSIGWLKGQRLDGANMSDRAAWEAKGREECARIQDQFKFTDEEVTVGRHIYGTPVYLEQSLLNVMGKARPVTHRMYNEHVYTKCLMGNGHASTEMAYCYYKGCVLPDGKIGHNTECGFKKL